MSSDEDTFFEDDEYEEDDSFPDEEVEEEDDDEEYEEDYDLEDEGLPQPSFKERMATFIEDPWPRIVFYLMVIGFAVVLLTPPNTWAIHRYSIIGVYLLTILAGVAAVYSMITWIRAGADKLRYAGITNLAVVVMATILGVLDTTFWIVFGVSVIPGYQVSLLFISYVLVIFSLYSLWMIQKSLNPQVRR